MSLNPREWLPHLLVGLLALSAGSFCSWLSSSSDKEWKDREHALLGGLDHRIGNVSYEAQLPPRPLIAWSAFSFTAIAGFYVAAAVSGWVHRESEW